MGWLNANVQPSKNQAARWFGLPAGATAREGVQAVSLEALEPPRGFGRD